MYKSAAILLIQFAFWSTGASVTLFTIFMLSPLVPDVGIELQLSSSL